MTTFQIIEAKPWHCGQMVHLLAVEKQCVIARLGMPEAHRQMRQCFDGAVQRRAWLIDGEIAALGGIIGSPLSLHGYLWLAVSNRARKYPLSFIKEMRRQLDAATASFRQLSATLVSNESDDVWRDMRFAAAFGFKASADQIDVGRDAMTVRYDLREAA
jgi:hypothetical protein